MEKSEIKEKQIKETRDLSFIAKIGKFEIHENPIYGDESPLLIYDTVCGYVFDSEHYGWLDARDEIYNSFSNIF